LDWQKAQKEKLEDMEVSEVELDAGTLEKLKSLGYVH
jgi:hypothetical protein